MNVTAAQTSGYVGDNTPFRIDSGGWIVAPGAGLGGEILKTLRCTSSGIVSVDSSALKLATGSSGYGTWEFWVNKASASNMVIWIGDQLTPFTGINGYRLIFGPTGIVSFSRLTAAVATTITQTAAGAFSAAVWNKITITRRYDGQWSIYLNGALLTAALGTNPVTDNAYSNLAYWSYDFDSGDYMSLSGRDDTGIKDEYAVKKYLGVVAP